MGYSMLLSDDDKAQELGMCPCCFHDMEEEINIRNKEIIDDDEFWRKEEAWFFYESGIQDVREKKRYYNIYKFM